MTLDDDATDEPTRDADRLIADVYQALRQLAERYLRGKRERAVELLRLAIERGYHSARLFEDPDLISLRGDPEFEALVAMLQDQRQRTSAGEARRAA